MSEIDSSSRASSGRVFHVGPLISRGDFCDYFETNADGVPCVLKVVHHEDDGDLLDREADTLRALWSSPVHGGDHFTKYLPRLVDTTRLQDGRAVNVLASGNPCAMPADYYAFPQILAEYPQGLSPRHVVWMGNRMLDILAWVHKGGVVHGAMLPPHAMYRPPDHAGMLWNWCYATRMKDRVHVPAIIEAYRTWYPPEMIVEKRPPMPADDTGMLARCLIQALGGDPLTGEVPPRVFEDEQGKDPDPIIDLIQSMLPQPGIPRHPNTVELHELFGATAERVYGPKRFVEFIMPVN